MESPSTASTASSDTEDDVKRILEGEAFQWRELHTFTDTSDPRTGYDSPSYDLPLRDSADSADSAESDDDLPPLVSDSDEEPESEEPQESEESEEPEESEESEESEEPQESEESEESEEPQESEDEEDSEDEPDYAPPLRATDPMPRLILFLTLMTLVLRLIEAFADLQQKQRPCLCFPLRR
jgi:hypothetical protein